MHGHLPDGAAVILRPPRPDGNRLLAPFRAGPAGPRLAEPRPPAHGPRGPLPARFIIFCIASKSRISLLTACTLVPLPAAMRRRREALSSCGRTRSRGSSTG